MDDAAPTSTESNERPLVLRLLVRLRAVIVLLPLLAGLLYAASVGADKLWADLPEKTLPPVVQTCWDGQEAATCAAPTGVRGLRWVFPSFRPGTGSCQERVRDQRKLERPLEWACTAPLDGSQVSITYSVRTSTEAGLAYLRRIFANQPQPAADGDRLVFAGTKPGPDGRFEVTVAYADHPFAVTVAATTLRLCDLALDELVQFRDADQVVVRKSSGDS
ncbi:hypothetical protein [Nocardioides sp.]|uniref:hypothetical protein n=1 Tax=Nocardioides sp. TaxID=35761 RepID=UPI00286AA591|nr:hypothetical protein [Nocardioides sp.]